MKNLQEPVAPWDINNNKQAFSKDNQKLTFKYCYNANQSLKKSNFHVGQLVGNLSC